MAVTLWPAGPACPSGLHGPALKSGLLPRVHLLVPSQPQPCPEVPLGQVPPAQVGTFAPLLTSPGAALPLPGQQADLCICPKAAVVPTAASGRSLKSSLAPQCMCAEIQGHRCEALVNVRRPTLPPAQLPS